jgi:hypothetical protein
MASTSGSALWLAGALPFGRQSQIGSPSLTLFWVASCIPISSLSYGGSDPQILKGVEAPVRAMLPADYYTCLSRFPSPPSPSSTAASSSSTTTMAKRKATAEELLD